MTTLPAPWTTTGHLHLHPTGLHAYVPELTTHHVAELERLARAGATGLHVLEVHDEVEVTPIVALGRWCQATWGAYACDLDHDHGSVHQDHRRMRAWAPKPRVTSTAATPCTAHLEPAVHSWSCDHHSFTWHVDGGPCAPIPGAPYTSHSPPPLGRCHRCDDWLAGGRPVTPKPNAARILTGTATPPPTPTPNPCPTADANGRQCRRPHGHADDHAHGLRWAPWVRVDLGRWHRPTDADPTHMVCGLVIADPVTHPDPHPPWRCPECTGERTPTDHPCTARDPDGARCLHTEGHDGPHHSRDAAWTSPDCR